MFRASFDQPQITNVFSGLVLIFLHRYNFWIFSQPRVKLVWVLGLALVIFSMNNIIQTWKYLLQVPQPFYTSYMCLPVENPMMTQNNVLPHWPTLPCSQVAFQQAHLQRPPSPDLQLTQLPNATQYPLPSSYSIMDSFAHLASMNRYPAGRPVPQMMPLVAKKGRSDRSPPVCEVVQPDLVRMDKPYLYINLIQQVE